MKTNATEKELKTALRDAGRRYKNNLEFNRFEKKGNRIFFTLKVKDSKKPGAKRDKYTGRRIASACWHAHGHFFDTLLAKNSGAWVQVGGMRKAALFALFCLFFLPQLAQGETSRPGPTVYLPAIIQIESSGDPKAYNKRSGAIGICQITPKGALADWNQMHPRAKHTKKQLFNPKICEKIANWYLNTRIPLYLRRWRIPDTIENRLKCYNAGPTKFKKLFSTNSAMPHETIQYIVKYKLFCKNGKK